MVTRSKEQETNVLASKGEANYLWNWTNLSFKGGAIFIAATAFKTKTHQKKGRPNPPWPSSSIPQPHLKIPTAATWPRRRFVAVPVPRARGRLLRPNAGRRWRRAVRRAMEVPGLGWWEVKVGGRGCWTKNRGKNPKMDGENNGKPYEQMGWFGGTTWRIIPGLGDVVSKDHFHLFQPWSERPFGRGSQRTRCLRGRKLSMVIFTTYKAWGDPPSFKAIG